MNDTRTSLGERRMLMLLAVLVSLIGAALLVWGLLALVLGWQQGSLVAVHTTAFAICAVPAVACGVCVVEEFDDEYIDWLDATPPLFGMIVMGLLALMFGTLAVLALVGELTW
jgi:branched-subunit amino acid permease